MHKLEQAWQRAALNKKWFEASLAFDHRRWTTAGLKGLLAATEHPTQRAVLRAALARQVVVRPVASAAEVAKRQAAGNDGMDASDAPERNAKDWRLTQGLAFRLRWEPENLYRLAADAAQRAATLLRRRTVYVYADDGGHEDFAGFCAMLQTRLDETSPAGRTEYKNTYSPGPMENARHGRGQSLWVTAPTDGRDFDKLLGAPLDLAYAQGVAQQLREAYVHAVEEALAVHATDEPLAPATDAEPPGLGFARTDTDRVRQTLLNAFNISDPLDVYEGWQRQQAWTILNRISLQVTYGPETVAARFGAVVDVYPRPDGSAHALSWMLHAAPARDVLAQALWPAEDEAQGLAELPADLADPKAWRYLAAWQTTGLSMVTEKDSPAATSGLETALRGNATLVALASVRECLHFQESWTARAQGWLQQLELPENVVLRLNPTLPGHEAVALPASLVRKTMHDVARRYANLQGLTCDPQLPVAVALLNGTDAPPDPSPATLETLVFGLHGHLLLNNVDDWPDNLAESFFYRAPDKHEQRGPAAALRRGLGTWMRQALTPPGRALLADVLLRRSPLALRPSTTLGPVLAELPEREARSIGELLGCQVVRQLWGYEFSWALAFALGGAAHACVAVRPSLQERLQHTRIGNDVPAWTLQGPAALTYVEFAEPIQTHLEQHGQVQTRHLLMGAYLWTQECDEAGIAVRREDVAKHDTRLNLALALVTVSHYSRPHEPGADVYTFPSFRQFGWHGLNPEDSLNELLVALARDLSQKRRADELRYRAQESPLGDPDNAKREEIAANQTYEQALQALARVLFYMGMPEARSTTEDKSYGDNVGRGEHPLLHPRAPGKNKGSTESKETTVLHRIRIGPEYFDDDPPSSSGTTTGRTVTPHYREGHFRMQPVGVGRRDRVRIWIRPTLVGAKTFTEGVPRQYDVG